MWTVTVFDPWKPLADTEIVTGPFGTFDGILNCAQAAVIKLTASHIGEGASLALVRQLRMGTLL